VGLSAVVGGEGAGWAAGEEVEVHAERESEESLGDALHEPGECLGEVLFQAHLALEVGEDALDHETDACLCDLAGGTWAWPVALGCDEPDVDQLHAVAVLLTPEALISEQRAAGVCGSELQGTFALLPGLGTCEVLADGDALRVADEHQAHTPHEQAL